ncbi:MAG: arylsulfatase [bacterium]|nr:arylsulfatase [bacterium]
MISWYRNIVGFVILIACLSCKQEQVRPNVLIILTDDQGWGDVGYNGNDILETPNLDELAQESKVFDRFYVSPVCAPTRASLLTGRYHLSTGVSWVTHRKEVMRSDEVTIAEILKDEGYRTGLFGKWHNGKQFPQDPISQGFETFYGFKDGHLNNYFNPELLDGDNSVTPEGYITDILTEKAIEFIDSQEDPFFCYLAINTPHSPFQVPDKYFNKYQSKGLEDRLSCIYGMVENIDDNVGLILNQLKKSKKLENTIVIFLSDNGPNGDRYNGGLKGIKSHIDEGGVRVPAIIKYDKIGWNDGKRISNMSTHLDLLPTILDLTGIERSDIEYDGISLKSVIENDYDDDRKFYTHQVIRKFDTIPGAVRTSKYLLALKPDSKELFDLQADPGQTQNIYDKESKLADQLEDDYFTWFKEVTNKGIEPPKIETGHAQVEQILFPAQEIYTRFNLDFYGKEGWSNDYLIHFTDSSIASWQTNSVSVADYEILIKASGSSNSIGAKLNGKEVLTKNIESPLSKIKLPSPDKVERGEVYAYQWPEISLGTMTLEPGVNEIGITAKGAENFELKSLILKKLKP